MRPYASVFLIGLVILIQGCVLGVGWLPDSSGFIFTTPTGDVVVYDIATKQQRVVFHDRAAATTCWPAVSPNGKRFALAQLENADDEKHALLQIVVCDMQGKIEFRSEKLDFASYSGRDLQYSTQLIWSPDEQKILLHGHGLANQGTGFDCSAIFDIASRKLEKAWKDKAPAYFDGSPVRPDGAGFLLVAPDSGRYSWVDWSGNEKPITPSPGSRYQGGESGNATRTALYDSHWDGHTAILNTNRLHYQIDTDACHASFDRTPEVGQKIGEELIHKREMLASGMELLVLVRQDNNPSGNAVRIAARQKGDSQLTEVIAPIRDRMILLSLSPDRKHAIVRVSYGYRGSKADSIFVLDNSGQLIDTITIKQKGGPAAKYEDQ